MTISFPSNTLWATGKMGLGSDRSWFKSHSFLQVLVAGSLKSDTLVLSTTLGSGKACHIVAANNSNNDHSLDKKPYYVTNIVLAK